MRRVTDEELREPDVTITVSPFAAARHSTKEIDEILSRYDSGKVDEKGNNVIRMPAYAYRELERLMRGLKG